MRSHSHTRIDVAATANDHVLLAPNDVDVALLVLARHILRVQPASAPAARHVPEYRLLHDTRMYGLVAMQGHGGDLPYEYGVPLDQVTWVTGQLGIHAT